MFDGTSGWEGLADSASWLLDLGNLGGWSSDDVFSPWEHTAGIVGTPGQYASDWHQQGTAFTCAVVSQQMILQHFGIDVSEAQLVYDAVTNGWLTDAGTPITDMGRLLENYGVNVHQGFGTGIESLMSELVHGHGVIVPVDSGDMWNPGSFFRDLFGEHRPDHAVVVTGLDLSDPNHPQVYINDPGDPNGAGKAYPLDQFLHAWSDSGNLFLATDEAPPGLSDHSFLGSQFHSESGMYMDQSFWSQWLQSAFTNFDSESFKSALMAVGTAVATTAVHAIVDSIWDRLDDAGRNDLFLNI